MVQSIRMVGAEEALITKTLTCIVIEEGLLFAEDPFAFLFLHTQPRNLENVRKSLMTIPEVISADTVFGPYDIICPVRAEDRTNLEQVVSNVHNIPGVVGTMIAVVVLMRT
ncbi:MAG: Lrp/AsnC family transcriptional regulator [Thermoproteota archaeon]|nr:Lrp/AsnC family transcriptional regulator [Thermoproteota archaeon]